MKIKEEIYSNKKPKFKINDRVRIFKYKNKFEKGYRGYWTKEVFKVTKINNTNPIMYTIQDLNNEKNSRIILHRRITEIRILKFFN